MENKIYTIDRTKVLKPAQELKVEVNVSKKKRKVYQDRLDKLYRNTFVSNGQLLSECSPRIVLTKSKGVKNEQKN